MGSCPLWPVCQSLLIPTRQVPHSSFLLHTPQQARPRQPGPAPPTERRDHQATDWSNVWFENTDGMVGLFWLVGGCFQLDPASMSPALCIAWLHSLLSGQLILAAFLSSGCQSAQLNIALLCEFVLWYVMPVFEAVCYSTVFVDRLAPLFELLA